MSQYGLTQHSTAQHSTAQHSTAQQTQFSTPDRTTVSLFTVAVVNEYAVSWAPPLLLALLLSTAVMLKARALFSDDATMEEFITRSATLQNYLWSNRPRRLAASPGSPYSCFWQVHCGVTPADVLASAVTSQDSNAAAAANSYC